MSTAVAQRAHVVYRLFDSEGALLYVGLTRDLMRRVMDHASDRKWWLEVEPARTVVTSYPSHDEAAAAEVEAIVREAPRYNVSTARHVSSGKPPLVMKSHYYPPALYAEAMAKATERQENLSDVLREALERYVREQ